MADALDLARKVSEEQYIKIKPELIAAINEKFNQEFAKRFKEELDKHTATDEEVEEMLGEIFGRK